MTQHQKRPRPRREQDQQGGSALAPERVPRPQPRPANLRGPQTEGMYDGMDMRDETAQYGALGTRQRRGDPTEIIMHQTSSNNADSTRRGYEQRIEQGSSIGAHYLIEKDGDTSLTVPTDRVASHAKGHNSSAVGIENVGAPNQVNPRGDLHAQIDAMDLSPQLKARLMAMSAAELRRTMADNGNNIYPDITGEQKRSNWNLVNNLADDHGMDVSTDVHAHEDVQAKTIGEGENITEFIDTMVAWPGKIEELEDLVNRMRQFGANPTRLAELEDYLSQEQARKSAVDADGSPDEKALLDAEQILGHTDGPAHERERTRTDFYDDFYGNMGRLDEQLS